MNNNVNIHLLIAVLLIQRVASSVKLSSYCFSTLPRYNHLSRLSIVVSRGRRKWKIFVGVRNEVCLWGRALTHVTSRFVIDGCEGVLLSLVSPAKVFDLATPNLVQDTTSCMYTKSTTSNKRMIHIFYLVVCIC